jgi:hypothetical protein
LAKLTSTALGEGGISSILGALFLKAGEVEITSRRWNVERRSEVDIKKGNQNDTEVREGGYTLTATLSHIN